MLSILLYSLVGVQAPSMVRAWTVQSGYQTTILGSRNGVCYYAAITRLGAVRESDGKILCEKNFSWVSSSHLGSSYVVVSHGPKEASSLVTLDLKRGTLRDRLSLAAGPQTAVKEEKET